MRLLKRIVGRCEAPTESAICQFVQKVLQTDLLVDSTHGHRRRTVRTDDTVATVAESVKLNPRRLTFHQSCFTKLIHLQCLIDSEIEGNPPSTPLHTEATYKK